MASILIVEDDLTLQKSYAQILKAKGYDVAVAENTRQARSILTSTSVQLVLLDIMLPGDLNGFEFLSEIKRDETLKTIPVIIMTNLDSEKQTGLEMGAVDYFLKTTMSATDLAEKIHLYV